jgi:class 3 adenylate cyclase
VQEPRTRYATTRDGAYVAYQVSGGGDHDLLVFFGHGISVEDQLEGPAGPFIDRLSTLARVIRFDRRGTGLSDPLVAIDQSTWEQWLDDTVAVLDAAKAATVSVFATDMTSGVVAMLLAASVPQRVARLVLLNPHAAWLRSDDYPLGIPPEYADAVLERVRAEWLDDEAPVPLAIPSIERDEALSRWWKRARRRGMSPTIAQALYRNGQRTDLRAILPSVRVPTLVFLRDVQLDERDSVRARVQYVVDHLPDARLIEIDGNDSLAYLAPYENMVREIEEFVTGTRSPAPIDRVLATVMFTDLVDSTAQLSSLGDRVWRRRLDAHDALIRRQLEVFRGREVKMTGDGVVATFDGPARAIGCAQAIVDAAAGLGLDVRIGLHTGEIELRGDDIGGLAVHIGARVSQLAGPREILVSRTVVDLVAGSRLAFDDRGEHSLKGVEGTWRVFAVSG